MADEILSELPAWLLGEDDEVLPPLPPREGPPPRGLWDLPIFGAFWGADGADLRA